MRATGRQGGEFRVTDVPLEAQAAAEADPAGHCLAAEVMLSQLAGEQQQGPPEGVSSSQHKLLQLQIILLGGCSLNAANAVDDDVHCNSGKRVQVCRLQPVV